MRLSSLLKMSLAAIAVPPSLWLAGAPPALACIAGFVAALALVAWAWRRLARHRAQVAEIHAAFRAAMIATTAAVDPHPAAFVDWPARGRRCIDRTPTGRMARDVRCPAPRSAARARRSTRR